MKKLSIVLVVCLISVVFCFTARAQPLPGEYEFNDRAAGIWIEFLVGGQEGLPGNQIFAEKETLYQFGNREFDSDALRPVLSRVLLKQVTLLSEPEPGENGDKLFYEYQTLYNGGLLVLFNNPRVDWYNEEENANAAFVATLGISKVITRKFVTYESDGAPQEGQDNGNRDDDGAFLPTGEIAFRLTTTAEFGEYPGFKARIVALFKKAVPRSQPDTSGNILMGHALDNVKITIIGPKEEEPLEIPFDIKPGSCRNPLNVKSRGVLPAVIPGTVDLDVRDIDPSTIKLFVNGDRDNYVTLLRWAIEDVIDPDWIECDDWDEEDDDDDCYDVDEDRDRTTRCPHRHGDGKKDLVLKFSTQEIVNLITDPEDGQVVPLILHAELRDGTKVRGEDSVTLLVRGRQFDRERVKEFIKRFYWLCLGRDPDQGGWDGWADLLGNGTLSGAEVAEGFVFSTEFKLRNVSDEQYMTVLYRAFFDREPDNGGYRHWLAKLKTGKNRKEVFDGFIISQEFKLLCEQFGIDPN